MAIALLIISILEAVAKMLTLAQNAASLLHKVQAEGRDVTDEELDAIKADADLARDELVAAIAAARAQRA